MEQKHLVADDNNINRMIIKMHLESNNINVDEASDGVEVLELVKNTIYDVIWMDVEMPKMDGLKCTQNLRENNYNGTIIGVTAHTDNETKQKCYDHGMNYILEKPFFANTLLELTEKCKND